jgi:hypothetical protein
LLQNFPCLASVGDRESIQDSNGFRLAAKDARYCLPFITVPQNDGVKKDSYEKALKMENNRVVEEANDEFKTVLSILDPWNSFNE